MNSPWPWKIDPVELRLRCYRSGTRTRIFPTPARRCANATGQGGKPLAGATARPDRARCATGAIWSAGAWRRVSGKPCRCRRGRIVLTANGHAEVSCAASDIGTGTYTIMAQVAADTLGRRSRTSHQLGRIRRCRSAGGRRIVDGRHHVACDRRDGREIRKELLNMARR